MKTRRLIIVFCILLTHSLIFAQPILNCASMGIGGDPKLNIKKNKTDSPQTSDVIDWKLADIKAIDEPDSWQSGKVRSTLVALGEGKPVRVKAYLLMVRQGGKESCNCNLSGVVNNDLHLVFGKKPSALEPQSVTGEITPKIRLNHTGWTKSKLNVIADDEIEVRITGYVLLDTQHVGKSTPVRATNWEIHPITEFEVKVGNLWVPLDQYTPN